MSVVECLPPLALSPTHHSPTAHHSPLSPSPHTSLPPTTRNPNPNPSHRTVAATYGARSDLKPLLIASLLTFPADHPLRDHLIATAASSLASAISASLSDHRQDRAVPLPLSHGARSALSSSWIRASSSWIRASSSLHGHSGPSGSARRRAGSAPRRAALSASAVASRASTMSPTRSPFAAVAVRLTSPWPRREARPSQSHHGRLPQGEVVIPTTE
ncbi:uncharacterized protein [Triticum aestivum]|uniref:uncharacterized protein n=1 Tax=Triticum aestivum TaxID=4565 RepID=UPI001D00519D|nr:uncharacterized protein LOC123191812 [Triticum aestivum]